MSRSAHQKKEIVVRGVHELTPYTQNARVHNDQQVAMIAASIKEFGFNNPVLIDGKGNVIAGHGRLMAARKLGMDEVPCLVLDHMTEAQKRAYILADNQIATKSGWDKDLLRKELDALQGLAFDLNLTGFSSKELDALFPDRKKARADENNVPAQPSEPTSRLHDVWQLGPHRLVVGDATDRAVVDLLMDGQKADLVWTDPPYNVAIEGKAGKILNDDMGSQAFLDFLTAVFLNYHHAMRAGACIYVAHADSERANFTLAYQAGGLKLSQVLIWIKQSATLSRQDYNWQHEPILYGWKEGAGHFFAGDFTLTTVVDDDIDLDKMNKADLLTFAKELKAHLKTTAVRHDRPTKSDLHPTMKPIQLVRDQIEASSREGDLVLDFFGGSGSTLIAAETCGRRANLLELDPRFADVIITRWEEFTGQKAVLASDSDKTFDEVKRGRRKGK